MDFLWNFNTDTDSNTFIILNNYNSITLALQIIYKKYNYIDDNFLHINSIFACSIVRYNNNTLIMNVNRDKMKTFPLQIINKYDYLTMTYKRQKHKKFIRKWKEAVYKPNSMYYYKIKDNFEHYVLSEHNVNSGTSFAGSFEKMREIEDFAYAIPYNSFKNALEALDRLIMTHEKVV